MKFLIVPNFALPYDQRMVNGLAAGFLELGHEAVSLDSPLTAEPLVRIVEQNRADVVLQVNRFRPTDPPLPANVRHIAWFQDVFPDSNNSGKTPEREGDIVYALGTAQALGLKTEFPCFVGSLVTGVEPGILNTKRASSQRKVDFSLCGYIPPPLVWLSPSKKLRLARHVNDLYDRLPRLVRAWCSQHLQFRPLVRLRSKRPAQAELTQLLYAIVKATYRPLRGDLDILLLSDILRQATPSNPGATAKTESLINYLVREYPRLLDREALVGMALAVSNSLELYGPGWEQHEAFRPYYKGITNNHNALLEIFQRSRINLANNTHGLGLHSRTLECMAVCGFIFMHRSPHDEEPGGMLTSFEPGVHYGAYTPGTFHEEAKRWLRDDTITAKVGERAKAIIAEKHLWRHRAEQILDDLKR
jgi:Glycosyl transferases group 1